MFPASIAADTSSSIFRIPAGSAFASACTVSSVATASAPRPFAASALPRA